MQLLTRMTHLRAPRKSCPASLLLLGLFACSDFSTDPVPLSPARDPRLLAAAGERVVRSRHRTIDDDFEVLSGQISGFGGLFFDRQARLHVFLVNGSSRQRAVTKLQAFFASRPVSLAGGKHLDVLGLTVESARYDWKQLVDFRAAINTVKPVSEVHSLDIDETLNLILVGVDNEGARRRVTRRLQSAGIPTDAFQTRIVPRERDFSHSLLNTFRPVIGGVAIEWYSGVGNACTTGANVRSSGSTDPRFVTAAHCSVEPYSSADATPMFQPNYDSQWTYYIGSRSVTAPRFTSTQDPACPAGEYCRWSDAALSTYTTGVRDSLGFIARTELSGTWSGSIFINHAQPTWQITQEAPYPFVGEQLNKVGRTTGWTQGFVIADCANVRGTDGTVFLCQGQVEAGAGEGDSGAPVFGIISGSNVRLMGNVRGGISGQYFTFSPMDGTEYELGPLTTF
jgi:hypothetical protein